MDVLAELYRAHNERRKQERAMRHNVNREWADMTAEAGHQALLIGPHDDEL